MKLRTANENLFEQPIPTNSGESFPAEPFQLGGGTYKKIKSKLEDLMSIKFIVSRKSQPAGGR